LKKKVILKSKILTKKITKKEIRNKIIKKIKESNTSEKKNHEIKTIGSLLTQSKLKKAKLHSEKHYLVDETRNYFGETSKKGIGSFSFYLGFFKNIPEKIIYQFWSEVKQSNKSIKDQQKLFWWKVGQYIKNNK